MNLYEISRVVSHWHWAGNSGYIRTTAILSDICILLLLSRWIMICFLSDQHGWPLLNGFTFYIVPCKRSMSSGHCDYTIDWPNQHQASMRSQMTICRVATKQPHLEVYFFLFLSITTDLYFSGCTPTFKTDAMCMWVAWRIFFLHF